MYIRSCTHTVSNVCRAVKSIVGYGHLGVNSICQINTNSLWATTSIRKQQNHLDEKKRLCWATGKCMCGASLNNTICHDVRLFVLSTLQRRLKWHTPEWRQFYERNVLLLTITKAPESSTLRNTGSLSLPPTQSLPQGLFSNAKAIWCEHITGGLMASAFWVTWMWFLWAGSLPCNQWVSLLYAGVSLCPDLQLL